MSGRFEYLQRKLEPQEKWHDDIAKLNKWLFYTMEVATVLAGAAIPVVNLWVSNSAAVIPMERPAAMIAPVLVPPM